MSIIESLSEMSFIPLSYRFGCQIAALCILWYTISSASSIVNKVTLQNYPYPMTVALTSLCSVPLYASPLLRLWRVKQLHIPMDYMMRYVVPLSIGKAIAVACAYFSLWKVPVSYAHTVKATMPLFAVICARLVLKERQSIRVYLSLVPIIAGVIIASLTELSFNFAGLISALLSTATYSLLNVLVKRVLKDTEVHPIKLLAINSQIAAVVFFPFWCLRDGITIWGQFTSLDSEEESLPDARFILYLFVSGLLSFGQNLCAFTLIHRLTALSYAVTNAAKRITVISSSLLTLHNPVTPSNVFGMLLAILGVFIYNRAKQSQKERTAGLPLSRTDMTLSDASLVMLNGGVTSRASRLVFNNNNNNNNNNDKMMTRRIDETDDSLFFRSKSPERSDTKPLFDLNDNKQTQNNRNNFRFIM